MRIPRTSACALILGIGIGVAVTHAAVIRAAILAVMGASAACFARIDVTPLSLTDLRSDGRRWTLRATGLTVR